MATSDSVDEDAIYDDPDPAVRALVLQNIHAMTTRDELVKVYQDPTTRFDVVTWSGRCRLPPLALAIEVPGYHFQRVLDALMECRELDLRAPYVIEDLASGTRIRTNALTHLLARWDPSKTEGCRHTVLLALLSAGADTTALYEVTPFEASHGLETGGWSLMAFMLGQRLPVPAPFYFVEDLIKEGHSRFRAEDPPGLFARAVLQQDNRNETVGWLRDIMETLAPTLHEQGLRRIAFGTLRPEEVARGELRRIVRGTDAPSGLTLLHVYALYGGWTPDDEEVMRERIRMLCAVYGLSPLTPTADGRDLEALAAESGSNQMREAVAAAVGEVVGPRHLALAIVQGLRRLPTLALDDIGRRTGLPLLSAHALDERLVPGDDPRRRRFGSA
jgi:hypothetical protein